MAFPSKGFIFLILLGLGDQENEAMFPELLQRIEQGGGSGGLSEMQRLGREPVARGDFPLGEWREHCIRRGSGFQPCLCWEFAL